jgi:hypothetical protein
LSDLASLFCHFWKNFLDYQAREFTIVEYCGLLLESCFQAAMVELLTLRANCSLLALKPAMSSPYLPPTSGKPPEADP